LFATIDGKAIDKRMKILDHWVSNKTGAELARYDTDWEDGHYDTRINHPCNSTSSDLIGKKIRSEQASFMRVQIGHDPPLILHV